jgi:hypothetical protein
MSFSTLIAALRTQVPIVLGGTRSELPNPYDVERNHSGMRRDSWGITVGDSALGLAEFNSIVDRHIISVVLARELVMTDNHPTAMVTAVNALKADAELLQRSLDGKTSLLGVEQFTYASTSGISFGGEEREQWVSLAVTFVASIRQVLT